MVFHEGHHNDEIQSGLFLQKKRRMTCSVYMTTFLVHFPAFLIEVAQPMNDQCFACCNFRFMFNEKAKFLPNVYSTVELNKKDRLEKHNIKPKTWTTGHARS